MGYKYIIVTIDRFTPYVELFPKHEVSAIAAADALWRHRCRFTAPLEIVMDFGSQFMNQLITHFNEKTGIKHHTTIPSSKEENGIERENGLIRRSTGTYDILFDKGNFKNWFRLLCMTERVLNTSVKQPLGVSPNTLLFGNAFSTDPSLLTQLDRDMAAFVDTLVECQAKIIDAPIQSNGG